MNQVEVYPISRKELFNKYSKHVSRSTFLLWCKALQEQGKLRKGKGILTVKELLAFYSEYGVPGSYSTSYIEGHLYSD